MIFGTLFDDQRRDPAVLNSLMDELEHGMENDPRMKELVTPWVADRISDLSVLSQCLHQLELYLPWAASLENDMKQREEELENAFMRTTEHIKPPVDVLGPIVSLDIPTGGRFHYPIDKRRTRENVEAMRQAEQNLDSFWKAFDREMIRKNGISPRLKNLLSQRVLQRTPAWVEPEKGAKARPMTSDVDELAKPLSELYFDLEHRTEKTVDYSHLPGTKEKIKTRGKPEKAEAPAPEPELLERHRPDVQPSFKVDKRALKAFKTIFFIPSATSQPGEIAWPDFVHALCSIGFSAEKLYGSVWQFTPSKLDVERSIQFHEPHPSGRVPFRTARRHGRRLNRAYGWHGGMFALA